MVHILIAALCACLITTNHLTAGAAGAASRAKEAAQLKAAIEASLRESKRTKADDELQRALAQSKQEFETKGKREKEEMRVAIERSKETAEAEGTGRGKKERGGIGAREKQWFIEILEDFADVLNNMGILNELVVAQDLIKQLKSQPYNISTLQSVKSVLDKHMPDIERHLEAHDEVLEDYEALVERVGYEIDRLKGVAGVSFRDYYKKYKAEVDHDVASLNLDLSNSNLIDLTDLDDKHVPGLYSITGLNLSGNKLKRVPDNIGEFKALTELRLDDNYLTSIGENIGKLNNLTTLHLHDNYLSDLPANLAHLPLTHVCIHHNKFTAIPAIFQRLAGLDGLEVNNNMIAVIPDWVGDLPQLVFLDFSSNRIAVLPESISRLRGLTILLLTNNKIEEVPEWIGDLVNLNELGLNNNKVSSLPKSITKLVNLRDLFLSGNEFTVAPEGLNNLPALQRLGLRNNPLPYTDAELRKMLALPAHVESFLYKTPAQEKVEGALIDAIKKGDDDAVHKAFTTIMAGRILIGPEPANEKIDLSKYRDAKGNNILQIVLQALIDKRKAILADKKLSAQQQVDALYDAEVLYTKIYLTLTQFGGPKVYNMIIARNKAGQDLIQSAVGKLNPDSFFLQTIREERRSKGAEGQPAELFKVALRYKKEKEQAAAVGQEQTEQKTRLQAEKVVAEQQRKPESKPTNLD